MELLHLDLLMLPFRLLGRDSGDISVEGRTSIDIDVIGIRF
jgi:hypothetical protein